MYKIKDLLNKPLAKILNITINLIKFKLLSMY